VIFKVYKKCARVGIRDIRNLYIYITIRCYGLDGPGIESRWGRDFPQLCGPALRHSQPPIQWVPGPSRG